MKKSFAVILTVFMIFTLLLPVGVAFADSTIYYVVGDNEIAFYESDFELGLISKFDLPKGFAFTLTGDVKGKYSQINYSGINGYVLTSTLSGCTKTTSPEKTAPTFVLTASPAKAYTGFAEGNTVNIDVDQAFYLGSISDGGDLYYAVKVKDGIYYIFSGALSNGDALNEYLDPSSAATETGVIVTPSGVDEPEKDGANSNFILRLILVLGIIIPAVIVIILLFKPRKANQRKRRELDDDGIRYDEFE